MSTSESCGVKSLVPDTAEFNRLDILASDDGLKLRIAVTSLFALAAPASLLITLGVSEKEVLLSLCALFLPIQLLLARVSISHSNVHDPTRSERALVRGVTWMLIALLSAYYWFTRALSHRKAD